MASDRLVPRWLKYAMTFALIILLGSAGYYFGKALYNLAFLLLISGVGVLMVLLWLYDNTGKTVSFFFNALKNNDTSIQFPVDIKQKSLARLHENMNQVIRLFQNLKMKSEYKENYYKALIKHATSGLLVLNHENKVELINESACKYAGISPDSTNPDLLKIKNPRFYEAVCSLKPGDDVIYKHIHGNEYQLLTFRASLLLKEGQTLKLVSVNDIRQEMESKEIESYRKLISVLTHEIMNLVTPLTSVSGSLQSLYHINGKPIGVSALNEDVLKTTQQGLQLIEEQSRGLTAFIETYRKLSKIPRPEIKEFEINEWFDQIRIVYSSKMSENRIDFKLTNDNNLKHISADKNLMNQVIINILNNAIDAVSENEDNRQISIMISVSRQGRNHIRISNNGPIIPPEILEKIFVPFFTTKTNGSGIGLSICQEIMKMHRGSLAVISNHSSGTVFIAEF